VSNGDPGDELHGAGDEAADYLRAQGTGSRPPNPAVGEAAAPPFGPGPGGFSGPGVPFSQSSWGFDRGVLLDGVELVLAHLRARGLDLEPVNAYDRTPWASAVYRAVRDLHHREQASWDVDQVINRVVARIRENAKQQAGAAAVAAAIQRAVESAEAHARTQTEARDRVWAITAARAGVSVDELKRLGSFPEEAALRLDNQQRLDHDASLAARQRRLEQGKEIADLDRASGRAALEDTMHRFYGPVSFLFATGAGGVAAYKVTKTGAGGWAIPAAVLVFFGTLVASRILKPYVIANPNIGTLVLSGAAMAAVPRLAGGIGAVATEVIKNNQQPEPPAQTQPHYPGQPQYPGVPLGFPPSPGQRPEAPQDWTVHAGGRRGG